MRILAIILLLAGHVFSGISQPALSDLGPTSTLSKRDYWINPNSLLRTARRAAAEKEIQEDNVVLQTYFKQIGIDLSPPSSFSVNYEAKLLVVRSTSENLAKIAAILPPPPPAHYSRSYYLGVKDLFPRVRRAVGSDQTQSNFDAFRCFLEQNDVDISRPSTWFYSEGKQMLIVTSTLDNLDKIEKIITELTAEK